MTPKLAKSFDDLIANYYGSSENPLKEPATTEELFASYYGRPTTRSSKARPKPAVVLSLSCDDCSETLEQRRRYRARTEPASSRPRRQTALASQKSFADAMDSSGGMQDVPPAREIQVDFAPQAPEPPSASRAVVEPDFEPRRPSMPAPPAPPQSGRDKSGIPGPNDDEFEADLKAILNGQKVYDPVSGKTVEKDKVSGARANGSSVSAPPPPPPPPAPPNDSQAIFDRIAQSMQYANAFDLGTVELQNRFADFDRMEEYRRQAAAEKQAAKNRAATTPATSRSAKPDSKDFIEDLEVIRRQHDSPADLGYTESMSLVGNLADALYDTGEHVLAAETLYADKFTVGKPPGVKFSYGQIIAMGDMYESVNQMVTAPAAELQRLKTLIIQSTNYYKSGKKSGTDVKNETFDKATAGRFMQLAEDNYDHFAPNILFKGAAFAKATPRYGNHKAAWERHHKWAYEEANKDPKMTVAGYFAEWPLLINAFGDHFLTDAFAAGHIINKEAIIDYFKATFLDKGKLTSEAKAFFDKLAAKSFTGDVKKKFSDLETAQPLDAWWNIVNWHPNIDSADRFASLLEGICEKEPDRIGNLAVKALHDKLNKDGITVDNKAGSGPWELTGDGFLTPQTLGIMRQAVEQSVANILDPGILAGTVTIAMCYDRVWKYVPELTSASQAKVKALAKTYVTPTSSALLDAAADLVRAELNTMISLLIDKKVLRKA